MRYFLTYAATVTFVSGVAFAQAPQYNYEQNQQQMKAAQEQLNSPEMRAQMEKAMQQMRAAGIDPKTMGMADAMPGQTLEASMQMNQCLHDRVGDDKMSRLMQEADQTRIKIQSLCAAGKRSEAESVRKEYAEKMAASKEYAGMRDCSLRYAEKMRSAAKPDATMMAMRHSLDMAGVQKQGDHHVCEGMMPK